MSNSLVSPTRYLTENEVSEVTAFSLSKLRQDRFLKKGIPYLKIGRSVRYRPDDIRAYMEARRIVTAGSREVGNA